MGNEPGKLTSKHLDKNHVFESDQLNYESNKDVFNPKPVKGLIHKNSLPIVLNEKGKEKTKSKLSIDKGEISEVIQFLEEIKELEHEILVY